MKRIDVLNRIQEIYTKLENDRLDLKEIEELVDLSNNLYERSLILRYKVAEQRIFGREEDASTNEIANETDELSEVSMKESEVPQAIDFSIFESVEEEVLEKTEGLPEAAQSEPAKELIELNFEDTVDLAEEKSAEPVFEPEAEQEPELEEEMEVVLEEKIAPSSNGNWSAVFDKIIADHSSSIQKHIPTLAGSFGLNERILFINELFNGEAEKFSNAILEMDKTENWNTCKVLMDNFAAEQNWDKESDTVGEFVLHVRRKHA
jgi:hypothetical protein